jgi:hypothetical protein
MEVHMVNLSSRRTAKPQDWINLALATLLFLSPWALGFADHLTAARTAWASGIVIAFIALAAIVEFAEWEEWINLLLGLWLIIAPWVLGFAGVALAMRAHVALGVLIALFSAWELWTVHHETSHA